MEHTSSEILSPERVYHAHTFTYFFLSKIHFNIIIPSAPICFECSLTFMFFFEKTFTTFKMFRPSKR
jgi:hypothetical protein